MIFGRINHSRTNGSSYFFSTLDVLVFIHILVAIKNKIIK